MSVVLSGSGLPFVVVFLLGDTDSYVFVWFFEWGLHTILFSVAHQVEDTDSHTFCMFLSWRCILSRFCVALSDGDCALSIACDAVASLWLPVAKCRL